MHCLARLRAAVGADSIVLFAFALPDVFRGMATSAFKSAYGAPDVRPRIAIQVADTADLREAVYRFRYDIYVRELRRPQKDADHARGRIEDALDETGINLAAVDSVTGAVVGCVRTNLLRRGRLPLYERLYGTREWSAAQRDEASITTRMMVTRPLRRTSLPLRIAIAVYCLGIRERIATDVIDCNDPLRDFFARLGYVWRGHIEHPEYGRVNLMELALSDAAHLASTRSPFVPFLKRRDADSMASTSQD